MKPFVLLCVAASLAANPLIAQKSLVVEPAPLGSPRPDKVITKCAETYADLKTLSADFEYIVRSKTRAQVVRGHVRLMKPNFARLTLERIAEPAYPNLIGSDGKLTYTFVPPGYNKDVTPVPFPGYDPLRAARQASGLEAGGTIRTTKVSRDGRELRLWDSIALQAFFDLNDALDYFYAGRKSFIVVEGTRVVEGVRYTVLYNHLSGGSIAGAAMSDFEQRLFIDADGLIKLYTIQFKEAGEAGLQMMRLSNLKVNEPMTPEDFAFTPPAKQ
jgi:outer membrane lipoprotein-sorting protein